MELKNLYPIKPYELIFHHIKKYVTDLMDPSGRIGSVVFLYYSVSVVFLYYSVTVWFTLQTDVQ